VRFSQIWGSIDDTIYFGSPSSIDRDVLVLVDTLPTLEASKTIATQLAPHIRSHFKDAKKQQFLAECCAPPSSGCGLFS
jgi:hypothetical protein